MLIPSLVLFRLTIMLVFLTASSRIIALVEDSSHVCVDLIGYDFRGGGREKAYDTMMRTLVQKMPFDDGASSFHWILLEMFLA